MKRFISFAIAIAVSLALTVFVFPVQAQKALPTVIVGSAEGAAGGQVDVDVTVENNGGFSGFSFCVGFGQSLIFTGADIALDGYKVTSELSGGMVNLAWTGESFDSDGKLATLHFNVASDAKSESVPLNVVFRDRYDSFYTVENWEEQDIEVGSVDGFVTVHPSADTGMTVSVGSVRAEADASGIAVPITVKNNTGFDGFSFCVDYDHKRLTLERAEIVIEDGYKVINHPTDFDLLLAWTSVNEITDDLIVAKLYFSVKENAPDGKGHISIQMRQGVDSFYKVVNYEETDLDVTVKNGYVEVIEYSVYDTNKDGRVDISDVTALLDYLASANTDDPTFDVNLDGKVNISDVTVLLNYLATA